MPLILAEELDTLTVEDIQEWERRAGNTTGLHIEVIDKRNLTSERLARLQSLVRERNEPSEARPVDADELNAKLRQISPRRSPSPSDTDSTASTRVTAGAGLTEEQVIAGVQRIAYKNHKKLRSVGGRPSRAINPDPGPCPVSRSDIDKRYHVSDHWHREAGRTGRELDQWLDFRWHQFEMRKDSNIFNKYKEAVDKYREKKGINWIVELQLDRQTKLDEWHEYYVYERQKRLPLERKLEEAKRELKTRKERMKATRNGTVGVPRTMSSGHWEELRRYNQKLSHAQKKVDMARTRLEVLKVEESLSAAERDIMVQEVEEDLESAQKSLEAEKSDELDQLNTERRIAQEAVTAGEREVKYANECLEKVDDLLQWIAGQFAEIATEYTSSGWGSQHNRDLLDGWEKYYVYMREKLQVAQDGVAKSVQEQVEGRMRKEDLHYFQFQKDQTKKKEEEFNTLWVWGKREFPEIAARHPLFSHDSQSNGDHQAGDQASQPKGGKSTQRTGRPARKQSPFSQVQPSKVSKPIQRRRNSLSEKLNATRHAVWPSEVDANDVGQVKGQRPLKVAVRRSERISQRACDPAPTLVRAREKSSQCRPDGTLRRSARILERTEKLHSLGSDQEAKPAQSSMTARRKLTRHTTVHTDTAYSGTPQGISKTRRWKATSRKGRNV